MKLISILALSVLLASCSTPQTSTPVAAAPQADSERNPAAADLTGDYLGEGLFSEREEGLKRPAIRLYMDRAPGEADTYNVVLFEYTNLLEMSLPFLASDKAPVLTKVTGFLNEIGTRIEAFKAVPGARAGTYNLHVLLVRNGTLVPAQNHSLVLSLDPTKQKLAGAKIVGKKDGTIVFTEAQPKSFGGKLIDALSLTQYEMAALAYKKGHLKSSWRGNWNDLEGSYLSMYGKLKDGVHELYTENGHHKVKFLKTKVTKAKDFTNPKSAPLVGEYFVSEPIPKMYLLTPVNKNKRTASDAELTGRIGLFLDVFDASAPEAGSKMVTELVYTNPADPEDFLMYYEHPQHLKNVGVDGAVKK